MVKFFCFGKFGYFSTRIPIMAARTCANASFSVHSKMVSLVVGYLHGKPSLDQEALFSITGRFPDTEK